MVRSFLAGLGLVVVVAAAGLLLLRPRGADPPAATPAVTQEVAAVPAPAIIAAGPPPAREDLIRLLCAEPAGRKACVHDLMRIYRACGIDVTHPRTHGCAAVRREVRRRAR